MMKKTGNRRYAKWMAAVMNLAAAAMMGVFVYGLRIW